MRKSCYQESWEGEGRLKELGISSLILKEAVKTGEMYRSECTMNDPKSVPGYIAWARTTRALREMLIPLGWERHEISNLPMVINRDKKIAIVVSSGDEATGHANLIAQTKYSKGRATESVVVKNAVQLALFQTAEKIKPIKTVDSGYITWFLLVSRQDNQIFYELSLPNKIQNGKPIGNWSESIFFQPIDIDAINNTLPSEADYLDEITVQVTRKSNQ